MRLQSLVFCSDEKILRVLRRVLSDLEITVEHCADADSAIHKLTRQRFEAVIVDCADERAASQVLRSARTAPCNKRAVAVAILDGQKAMHSAFDLGAHFVLYKPIVTERAKASFRAARALMKCERRRNTRIPVEMPVTLSFQGGSVQERTSTSDLGEGGIAVQPAPSRKAAGSMTVSFTLPGADYKVECAGEIAWANSGRQAGIRFVDLPAEAHQHLKVWLESHSPDMEKDDPPVPCKLTDLSPAAGYLETNAPFPVHTKVVLSMQVAERGVKVEGMVRVAHPEAGMGVEFARNTAEQQEQLNGFIQALIECNGILPEIQVQPEGLDVIAPGAAAQTTPNADPLLELFLKSCSVPTEVFLQELSKHRGQPEPAESIASA